MLRGLYTVSTVLEQNTTELNVISNNLANINTTGYKKDVSMFEEFRGQLLHRINGSSNFGKQEAVKVTSKEHNGLFNLETNEGFFRINAVGGVSYSRSLAFRKDADGYLKTYYKNSNGSIIENRGYKVLGKNGPIKLEENQTFSVDEAGNLLVDGNAVDNLIYARKRGVIGTMSGGVKLMRTAVNYEQGEFIQTHNPLDLSISGKGFFVVNTPNGIRYTRDGSFKLNGEGTLMTDEGYEVQGIEGRITGIKGDVSINEFGEISQNGLVIDKIQTIEPSKIEKLKKQGDNLYRYEAELTEDEKNISGKIMQGSLEGSNVNSVEEMVKMIETYRAYESANKVIRAYDDTLAMAVNDIAKI